MNFKRATLFVRAIFSPPENWLAGHYRFFVAAVVGMLVVNELWQYGADVTQWDSMLVSGAITFVAGIGLALAMPSRTDEMLTRLVNRGVLHAPPENVELFKQLL